MFLNQYKFHRRKFLILGLLPVISSCCFFSTTQEKFVAQILSLEKQYRAEIGCVVRNLAGQVLWEWRSQEEFALNSTIKALLAARVIKEGVNKQILISNVKRVSGSPVLSHYLPGEKISLFRLAEVACAWSDNTATNLLLDYYGGPSRMTKWIRQVGDRFTRMDRMETELNITSKKDPRDKTRPASVTLLWQKIYLSMSDQQKQQWEAMLTQNKFSHHLMKNGLPKGWKVADRTGAGTSQNESNRALHAIVTNDSGEKFFVAIHVRMAPDKTIAERDEVVQQVSSVVLEAIKSLHV